MTTLKITNNSPYYDDFDESKNYYRILFRPGRAVQARELTQLQTSIQNQIEKFGGHIFRSGSIVTGGSFDIERSIPYVRIELDDNTDLDADSFIGEEVEGSSSNLRAYVTHAVEDDEVTNGLVLYVRYKNETENFDEFTSGEDIRIKDEDYGGTALEEEHTGKGFLFGIEEGTVFLYGFFIYFPSMIRVIDKYDDKPTGTLVFEPEFKYVDSSDDPDLLDNATGSPNFAAPGADRLSAELDLKLVDSDEDLGDKEVAELLSIEDGEITENKEKTQYSRINRELAKRTYEESGDYIVRGMTAYTREHLDTGDNQGRLKEENGGDPDLLSIGIEEGLAYAKGFRVEKLQTEYLDVPKAKDYQLSENQSSRVISGNYVMVNEMLGTPESDVAETAYLYDSSENRLSEKIELSESPSGSEIGTAKIRHILYESGDHGKPDAEFRIYLSDVRLTSGDYDDINAIGNNHFFADVVESEDGNKLRNRRETTQLISTGANHTRKIRNDNNEPNLQLTYERSGSFSVATDGKFTVTASSPEQFPYGTASLQNLSKRELFITLIDKARSEQSGTVSTTSGSKEVTGDGTHFTRLTEYDTIEIDGSEYHIDTIDDDSTLHVTEDVEDDHSDVSFYRVFHEGSAIDLTTNGSRTGNERIVDAEPEELSIDVDEEFTSEANIRFTYRLNRNDVHEIRKVLRPERLVQFNLDDLSDVKQLNLGISDVFKIHQVRHSDSEFENKNDGDEVTDQWKLLSGQTDHIYHHSQIEQRSEEFTSGYILVEFDYFEPDFSDGISYFSVDSYPVDDEQDSSTTIRTYEIPKFKSPITGEVYNLQNYLDFRPQLENTANDATSVSEASINPNTTEDIKGESSGLRIPLTGTQIDFDLSYYLARKDMIVLTREGNFEVKKGKPGVKPKLPQVSNDVMSLASVYIPPWPSLSGTWARIIGRPDLGANITRIAYTHYTMRDITKLENRINEIEKNLKLDELEKSVIDRKLIDEYGLNRYKHGAFVDGFLDHSKGKTSHEDYNIAIDKDEQVMRPKFEMHSVKNRIEESSGFEVHNPLITLKYSDKTLINQKFASTSRNIEQSVYRFIGLMNINPTNDIWVDEDITDKEYSLGDAGESLDTDWNSWEKYVTGVNANVDVNIDASDRNKYRWWWHSWQRRKYGNLADTSIESEIETEVDPEQRRTGIQTKVNAEEHKEEIGKIVNNLSVIPYIRPQKIFISASGLKENTRLYVFFDGEDMSEYVTPYTTPSKEYLKRGEKGDAEKDGSEGDTVRSDDNGQVFLSLRIPEGRFRAGTKKIRLTNSSSDSKDATVRAENEFHARGMQVKKTDSILSTETPKLNESDNNSPYGNYFYASMAYSFLVEAPRNEPGVFLTGMDLFIHSMHSELGFWVELRELNSEGEITRTQVPFSEIWVRPDDSEVNVNSDEPEATHLRFPSPVYLYNDTQYALVIHTEATNPDTYFWISRLGEEDVITGQTITGRALTGTLFASNDDLKFDIVPDTDLTVKFYRADFETGEQDGLILTNGNYEYIKLNDDILDFRVGDDVFGSEKITYSSSSGDDIPQEGDILKGESSGTQAEIITIDSITLHTKGFGFEEGEEITLEDSSENSKDWNAVVDDIKSGEARISKINKKHDRLVLYDSNGEFFEGCVVKDEDDEHEFELEEFVEFPFSTVRFNPNELELQGTSSEYEAKALGNDNETKGDWEEIDKENNITFTEEKILRSYSLEKRDDEKSLEVRGVLSTNSSYISPVIDMDKNNFICVHNLVNDDTSGEEKDGEGKLLNKYISKKITVNSEVEAHDIVAFLDAYVVPSNEIAMWVRLKHENDERDFESLSWIRLDLKESHSSSISDEDDFREHEFSLPDDEKNDDGEYVYEDDDGREFKGFHQFSIKIGLIGNNSARPIRISNPRVLALEPLPPLQD